MENKVELSGGDKKRFEKIIKGLDEVSKRFKFTYAFYEDGDDYIIEYDIGTDTGDIDPVSFSIGIDDGYIEEAKDEFDTDDEGEAVWKYVKEDIINEIEERCQECWNVRSFLKGGDSDDDYLTRKGEVCPLTKEDLLER